ncbi:MAG: citrate/2-methylcitrate synthase [Candidatus Peribacteraceae bacterium]|nr:citrate/2-methylcitrate synthase [Candidatus Peribacteraceae bacterium]|tara:strand:+ start:829 stop:2622 length:1794 start_codon:yes stop_codon:yes gene_type:complete
MTTLFDRSTTAIVYGRKNISIQRMLDFDFLSGRKPSVAVVVDPNSSAPIKVFFGKDELLLPVVRTLNEAKSKFPAADVIVNFASLRSAGAVVKEGIDLNYRVIATIAEGVPERDSREWVTKAKEKGVMLVGPATVGAVTAGVFRVGDTGSSNQHLLKSKLHRPGCVGYVGKSGGMSNEMYRMIAENSSGIVEGVAIGGDRNPGSILFDHLPRFESNPDVKLIIVTSEIGGKDEELIVEAIKKGELTKPIVAWVSGTSAECFPKDVQFGHAGAWAESKAETAEAKNELLRSAGVLVPESFEGLAETIRNAYQKLKNEGKVLDQMEPIVPEIPADRSHTHLQCTISDDRGEEAKYGDRTISDFIREGSLPKAIAKLWWKTELSPPTLEYLEMILTAVADHGPAVSGAHNAIVSASAGKDTMSALCSGLLTIGPRFGGAVDGAAQAFYFAHKNGLGPQEFVDEMKEKGERIPGIGHKIKSIHNPDSRVAELSNFAEHNFPNMPVTKFAREIELITTAKRSNLILNVDGFIGASLVDILLPQLPEELRESFFETGYLNGLFALGRSVGILGHIFDQKRLQTPLYRHPQKDIMYGEGTQTMM